MSRFCLGTHKINDMLCEVGVEFAVVVSDTLAAVGTVSSHDDIIYFDVE
jgi:hypothetical protein